MNICKKGFFRVGSCAVISVTLFWNILSFSNAQSPADDFARRQAEQQKKQQIDQLQRFTPNDLPQTQMQKVELPKNGTCFEVTSIKIDGVTKLSDKTILNITSPYRGKCVGLGDIQAIMKSLTNAYLDKGYVTSRIYIPEQDIKNSHRLNFIVVEGKLSNFYMNDKEASPYDGVIMSAFPRMKDRVLNMRDVEQGLDQMNRLASNNAKSKMLPGKDDGSTILNITNKTTKPWQMNISHDTLGQASTGYARYTVGLALDNILQVNDLWNFSYQKTSKDYWHDNDTDGRSNNYSGSVSIPNGYWTFNFSGYNYKYHSFIEGNYGASRTSGDSSELNGSASRVIHRDGNSITTLNLGLAYKETNNFLLGNKIEVGSRNYTVGNMGLSHSLQMLKGTWTFDLTYLQGLGIFGAVKKHEPGAGNANPEFSKFTATISAATPFKVAKQNFILSNLLVGQYAADNLFGAEQISLGSYSNVRGARESLIYGNRGFFSRNEILWRTVPWGNNSGLVKTLGEFRPYAGLDYGQVFAQAHYGFEDENLSSWTLGARLAGGHFTFDSGYSKIITTTVKQDKGSMAFVTVAINF